MLRLLPAEGADVTVSVVSHGHDGWLPGLLAGLARTGAGAVRRVVLTHNLPTQQAQQAQQALHGHWPFELVEIHNAQPLGFGANHNQAFARTDSALFCVLNPDIELSDPELWPRLRQALADPAVGAVTPALLNEDGTVQDHQRALVTPWALFLRRVLQRPDTQVDWFSASFLLLRSDVYRALGGFDEGFHMYCEDVDLCLRLQLAGYSLRCAPVAAVHHAQRDSLRQWRPLWWHVRSLVRLWLSRSFWSYLLTSAGRSRADRRR